uniref:Uncharacterized protein n=1 Tax=Anguilla anguilla TaxID=7936 RepID=A0A0E9PFQ7_ANGAN
MYFLRSPFGLPFKYFFFPLLPSTERRKRDLLAFPVATEQMQPSRF